MESHLRVAEAATALAVGRPIVLVDDENPDSDGELVLAAQLATADTVGFLVRYGSGFIRVAVNLETCLRMQLPPMVTHWSDAASSNEPLYSFSVAVDASSGITTGISATDRARTLRILADPSSSPDDVRRPGHVQVIKTHPRGVRGRFCAADAAFDLTRIAGLAPAAALCTLVSVDDPTQMARAHELVDFATDHDLCTLSIGDIRTYCSAGGGEPLAGPRPLPKLDRPVTQPFPSTRLRMSRDLPRCFP